MDEIVNRIEQISNEMKEESQRRARENDEFMSLLYGYFLAISKTTEIEKAHEIANKAINQMDQEVAQKIFNIIKGK